MLGIGSLITIILLRFNPWVILPTKSSPYNLTLVRHGGPFPNRIVMLHFIDDTLVNEYVLDLEIGLRNQQPQKYTLPEVNEGRVEMIVELEDGVIDENKKLLTVNYKQASDLYNDGLLLYLITDYASYTNIGDFVYYNQYVHFISGEERKTYFEKGGNTEWTLKSDTPLPKRFVRKDLEYTPLDYTWKENEWKINTPK